jgi:TRAP-type C4-dicarboxylate transport system permease small subunit
VAELISTNDPAATNEPAQRPRYDILFYIGACGLMAAMFVEALAVLGRLVGVPVLGALEIIQAAFLVTASTAMLSATLVRAHAMVHLILDRLSSPMRSVFERCAALISAALFAVLTYAVVWLSIEAWNEFEHSEVLHIPFRPLRVIVIVMTAAVAGVFAYQAVRYVAKGRNP